MWLTTAEMRKRRNEVKDSFRRGSQEWTGNLLHLGARAVETTTMKKEVF